MSVCCLHKATMKKHIEYNWSLITKYRNMLMGIGILGVMFAHCLEWGNVSGVIALIFKPFNGLVFTEGFLFLSGFGLYYSFSKNDELKGFYRKRVNRLLIHSFLFHYLSILNECYTTKGRLVSFY